jgi:hypothetical protein
MAEFSVYVIELDKEVLKNSSFRNANPAYNKSKPCVYVGQTAKTPEERFAQHLTGIRSGRFVKQFGLRLKPKLYEKHNSMASREEAEAKEQWLAERLRKKGYGVWWN